MATATEFTRLLRRYTAKDKALICLDQAKHPTCGAYLCQLAKGHSGSHQAACRKHHLCIVSWERADDRQAQG